MRNFLEWMKEMSDIFEDEKSQYVIYVTSRGPKRFRVLARSRYSVLLQRSDGGSWWANARAVYPDSWETMNRLNSQFKPRY